MHTDCSICAYDADAHINWEHLVMQDRDTRLDISALVSKRARSLDASGVRRIFDLGVALKDPINLSIGQPDFPVPREIKDVVIEAIENDRNSYTVTQGDAVVREHVRAHMVQEMKWDVDDDELEVMITAGTSGGLVLAALALLEEGDEVIIPDPWFVLYPQLARLAGARAVPCDTYPDFRLTAERIEPLISERTKAVLLATPSNPSGVVLSMPELEQIVDLCRDRGVVLIADEIYDEFTYDDALEDGYCPSPGRLSKDVLLIKGLGKTFGCTGWRLGFAAGPRPLIEEMTKLQQFTYVCAPSMAQQAFLARPHVDMSEEVASYADRRELVLERLGEVTNVVRPGGAFYVFVEVPPHLGLSGTEFVERAIEKNVLTVPGGVFSARDTHFRISYAVSRERLEQGLDILAELMRG